MDDNAIIDLYFQRDELAIVETDRKYGTFCHHIAMNILRIREDAQECVNDTWHAAWNKIPPVFPKSLRAFLGRITRNLSISRYRAGHAKKRYAGMEVLLSELEDCIPGSDQVELVIERQELSRVISGWLDSLSPGDCALFIRRYWYGDAVKSLALEYGCTPSQMAQRMLRLRRSLKNVLEREEASL